MATLNSQSVRKISILGRIHQDPSDDFVEKYSLEVSSILEYVSELEKISVENVDVFAGSRTLTVNELRKDVPNISGNYQQTRQNIINNFPKRQGNLLVIPNIFT
jgi:aspartyl/glutamyl-tRNA(Asn/Gln) amidotransferase C subunit